MTQPAVPGSANWQRQWTIDAGDVLLQPVTRRIAEDVLAGGPITRTFETGALHDRIPQAMGPVTFATWSPPGPSWRAMSAPDCCRICKYPAALASWRSGPLLGAASAGQGRALVDGRLGARGGVCTNVGRREQA